MKEFLFLLALLPLTAPALADTAASAGQCYTITDSDYRALCRAEAHKEPGMCYSIQRNDLRAECLAENHR